MSTYDNPAGRLQVLLAGLREQGSGSSLLNAWASVLDVEPDDVPLHLGEVGQLVRDVHDAVEHTDPEDAAAFLPIVKRHRGEWSNPIFPANVSFESKVSQVWPSVEALEALGGVSAFLHRVAPEAVVPDDEELRRIQEQINEVIAEVVASDDLPAELRDEIAVRLRAVQGAIDQIAIGGPRAVAMAMEALIGGVAYRAATSHSRDALESGTFQKVMRVITTLLAVFSLPSNVATAIEAGDAVAGELTAGVERVAGELEDGMTTGATVGQQDTREEAQTDRPHTPESGTKPDQPGPPATRGPDS